jgi:hypothetical protein
MSHRATELAKPEEPGVVEKAMHREGAHGS